jgi:hypothetical protein
MASLLSTPFMDVGSGIVPSDGALLNFYVVGSGTRKDTYTTASATTEHANPVVADALGVFPSIYISGAYDWVLTDKNAVQKNTGSVDEFVTVGENAFTKNFATLAEAVADTNLVDGDALNLAERTSGGGGGATWDVVLSSGVTENTYNIVQCTGVATLSLVLRVDEIIDPVTFGAIDGESSGAVQAVFDSIGVGGGSVRFSTNSTFGDILITDKENINIDFGMNTMTATASSAYLIKLTNSSENFKRGGVWENVIVSGTVTDAFLLIDGGAWSNQEFERIFSNNGVGPDLIKLNNATAILRNPSNFKFTQIWNKSFDIANAFHYLAAAATTSVDNFKFDQILHWSNQTTPSTLKFDGSGAQYSSFNNIYGALYAAGASVISTGTSAITRSEITGVLMEGSQSGRESLAGVYVECKISNVVNFYDESLYSANYAVNAKVQFCEMFQCLLQDSGTGYSALPSVILQTLSQENTLHHCNVVTDNGTNNTIIDNVAEYSEATWTPVIAFGGGSTGVTYTTQAGWYSRIGNTINYNCTVILSSKGTDVGAATISGLPFSSKAGVTSVGTLNIANTSFADYPQALIDASTSAIRLREVNVAGVASNLTDADFTNSSVVIITGTYFV